MKELYPVVAEIQESGYYTVDFPDFPELNDPELSYKTLTEVMDYGEQKIEERLRAIYAAGEHYPIPSKIAYLDFGERHPVAFYIPVNMTDIKEDT